MATTNKQLREWLSRFDDDAEIIVLTSKECRGHWESYTDVYKEDLVLPDVQVKDLKWSNEFDTVVFDIQYDYEQPCCMCLQLLSEGLQAYYDLFDTREP